jgi:hypothetical protein
MRRLLFGSLHAKSFDWCEPPGPGQDGASAPSSPSSSGRGASPAGSPGPGSPSGPRQQEQQKQQKQPWWKQLVGAGTGEGGALRPARLVMDSTLTAPVAGPMVLFPSDGVRIP